VSGLLNVVSFGKWNAETRQFDVPIRPHFRKTNRLAITCQELLGALAKGGFGALVGFGLRKNRLSQPQRWTFAGVTHEPIEVLARAFAR
jgi:hypothetical protein